MGEPIERMRVLKTGFLVENDQIVKIGKPNMVGEIVNNGCPISRCFGE